MQVTLVAYYGAKPKGLACLISYCQQRLAERLPGSFRSYALDQVHATIIGLEGESADGEVLNENFKILRKERKPMMFGRIIQLLRSSTVFPMQLQVGGFHPHKEYPFTSRGQHPYFRSFSIQGANAVLMGWPVKDGQYLSSLDDLRRQLPEAGVLHKYHRRHDDTDNDLFFVLGSVDTGLEQEARLTRTEEALRSCLAGLRSCTIPLRAEDLSVVGYWDRRLPVATSISFRLTDPWLNSNRMRDLYASEQVAQTPSRN